MPSVATHIEIRQNRSGMPRAYLEGTRTRVQDVALLAEWQGQTPDEIASTLPHLSLGQIHAALSYFFDHRDDILNEVREDAQFVSELQSQSPPSLMKARLMSRQPVHQHQANDAVSS